MQKVEPALQALPRDERPPAGSESSAKRDPLTGFYTQACFNSRLDRLIRKRVYRDTSLTLALLQLANFYEIASWVGTDQARLLLVDLACLLKETVPDDSWLCRCHSHEIAVLLLNDGSRRSTLIAERIHQALHSCSSQLVPPQLNLACHIGLVTIGNGTPDASIAFARARHDIWRRKQVRSAGQQLTIDGDMPDLSLPSRLKAALDNELFRISFQAIVSFQQDPLQRYELRATLADAQGQLCAGSFMDAVLVNALGEALDRLVIRRAVTVLAEDREKHRRLTVNVSLNSLVSPSFSDWLDTVLPGNMNGRLTLQASEIDLLITQHHLKRFCNKVRKAGLHLGIAHFGATENSFCYLPLFPASVVKLDHSRVTQLAESAERHQQLAAFIKQVRRRGMRVIAPCVEEISDLSRLWNAGVDLVQGYCLHRPSWRPDFEFVEDIELTLCP